LSNSGEENKVLELRNHGLILRQKVSLFLIGDAEGSEKKTLSFLFRKLLQRVECGRPVDRFELEFSAAGGKFFPRNYLNEH